MYIRTPHNLVGRDCKKKGISENNNTHKLALYEDISGKLIQKQERKCMYEHNTEAHSHNQWCCGKSISITYSVHLSVALVTQHAMHMCCIILSSVVCLALPYFSRHNHINGSICAKKSY